MRRSIKKQAQKSPKDPRRRCDSSRQDSSSSSSGASKATLVPEPDATMVSPSPTVSRRSASHSPRKASTSRRLSARSKSPALKSPPRPKSPRQTSSARSKSPLPPPPTDTTSTTKRARSRSRSSIITADSSLAASIRRSQRKKTAPEGFQAGKKSPVKEAGTKKSPTKRKVSKSPKRPDSLSLPTISEPAPKPSTTKVSKSTTFGRSLGKLDESETKGQEPENRSFVFVPTSHGLDHESLGRQMSQLYGYMKTVKAEGSEPSRQEASTSSRESGIDDERLLNLVIMDSLESVPTEDPVVSEQLITGVTNLGYISPPPPTPPPRRESLQSSSSSSSTSTSTLVPKGRLAYWGELTSRRHSVDASAGFCHSLGLDAEPGARVRPRLVRQRQVDIESSSSIEVHELQDILEPTKPESPAPSKRRLSKEKIRESKEEVAPPPKPIRKISFEDTRAEADAKGMPPPPPKPARDASASRQLSRTAYRDVRQSIESESDAIEVLGVDYIDSEDTRRRPRNDFRDWCSDSYTPSWLSSPSWSLSFPYEIECFWQAAYRGFLDMFQEKSVTVQQFFQNLSETLITKIRRPGQSAPRRFVLIAGYRIWLLVRDASNDYWFLCGRSRSKCCGRLWGPSMATQSAGDADSAQAEELPHLMKQAKKAAKKSKKKMKREDESTQTIRELIEMIHRISPVTPLEPQWDFTPDDCPFVTLSFEDSHPEEAATEEPTAGPSGESKPTKTEIAFVGQEKTEAAEVPLSRRKSRKERY